MESSQRKMVALFCRVLKTKQARKTGPVRKSLWLARARQTTGTWQRVGWELG